MIKAFDDFKDFKEFDEFDFRETRVTFICHSYSHIIMITAINE